MNPPTTEALRSCNTCGQPARSQDVDLAIFYDRITIPVYCQPCADREDRIQAKVIQDQKQQVENSARSSRLEIIPPEIRRTDISRTDFNLGLWLRIENWQPSGTKWLGIVGKAGRSKTRCIGKLAEKLILAGHRLHWTTAVEFQERSDDLRSDDRHIKAEASDYFRTCKRVAVLILDDFGKNTWTPTVERNLFSLIDHRKTHDLPVLWSSNTHPLDIGKSGELSRDRAAPLIGRLLEISKIEPV